MKQITIPQIKAELIKNEINRHEKDKEIQQLQNDIESQKINFTQALNTFKVEADQWKNKYLLTSPIKGQISFNSFIEQGQQLQINQPICFIDPTNISYYFQLVIPQYNFGKVRPGQKVILKLIAYPYVEFGELQGVVDNISSIPSDSGYLTKVSLTEGLTTNYKKQLSWHEIVFRTERYIDSGKK